MRRDHNVCTEAKKKKTTTKSNVVCVVMRISHMNWPRFTWCVLITINFFRLAFHVKQCAKTMCDSAKILVPLILTCHIMNSM